MAGKVNGIGAPVAPETTPETAGLPKSNGIHPAESAGSGFALSAPALPASATSVYRDAGRFASISSSSTPAARVLGSAEIIPLPLSPERIGQLVTEAKLPEVPAFIQRWEDLAEFLDQALAQAAPGATVEVNTERYRLFPLDPTQEQRARFTKIARRHPGKSFLMTISDGPDAPPYIVRSHGDEISNPPPPMPRQGGIVAVASGQTAALMDPGARILPDESYTLVSRDLDTLVEIREKGTNAGKMKVPLNPEGRKPILAYARRSFMEVLERQRPEVLLLNVPASEVENVVDDALIQYIIKHKPVIALPCKGEPNENNPYVKLYKRLADAGHVDCANRIVVIGGYYAAPWIVTGKKGVSITLAGGSREALETMAKYLSPEHLDENGRADWERMNVEIVEGVPEAVVVATAGSFKNILTKWAAHKLMREVMEGKTDDALKARLKYYADHNIKTTQELVARVVPHYGMTVDGKPINVDHIALPRGVVADIVNCLPQEAGIGRLIGYWERLDAMVRQGDLEALPGLIGDIFHEESDIGTRNSRDGFIDAVLERAYDGFSAAGIAQMSYERFRGRYYPDEWKDHRGQKEGGKDQRQEGRKSLDALLPFTDPRFDRSASRKRGAIALPKEIYEALELNYRESFAPLPELTERDVDHRTENQAWGMPQGWVQGLGYSLLTLKDLIVEINAEIRAGTPLDAAREIGLRKAVRALLSQLLMGARTRSAYTEITRRIRSNSVHARQLLKTLIRNSIAPEKKAAALEQFEGRLKQSAKLLQDTIAAFGMQKQENPAVTQVLAHLLIMARDLAEVNSALKKGASRRKSLTPLPRKPSGNGFSQGAIDLGAAEPTPLPSLRQAESEVSDLHDDTGPREIASHPFKTLMRAADLFASPNRPQDPKFLIAGSYALAVQEPVRPPKLSLVPPLDRQTGAFIPSNRVSARWNRMDGPRACRSLASSVRAPHTRLGRSVLFRR